MRPVIVSIIFSFIIFSSSFATIINVPADIDSIQGGINLASDGDTVLVADGLYYENINFRGKAITVASLFITDRDTNHINNTIIDGSQHSNPDSGSVVFFVSGEDTTSVLCGFTIRGGTGTNTMAVGLMWRAGGGVFCTNGGSATIINNHITGNQISGVQAAGGGICMVAQPEQAFLILEGNHISSNHVSTDTGDGYGGGVFCYGNVHAKIFNNVFERDTVISALKASGGAISFYCEDNNAYIIIDNNQIINNVASSTGGPGFGGGISIWGHGRIINNDISYNIATSTVIEANGGGIKITNTNTSNPYTILVKGNRITHNYAEGVKSAGHHGAKGGGIVNHYNIVHIDSNKILYNRLSANAVGDAFGAGISMYSPHSASKISRNVISFNTIANGFTSGGGGISLHYRGVPVTNNIIGGNSAEKGGGIYLYGSFKEIINNTIVNNTSSVEGGGLYASSTGSKVINTILWGNEAPNGSQAWGSFDINYSNIQGGWTGTGAENIAADPQFADTIIYELSDTSPCIGAGIDSINIGGNWYYAPPFDFDGDPRPIPIDSMPDMGAQEHELGAPTNIIKYSNQIKPESYELFQNYPNPFNPSTTIEFDLPKSSELTLKIFNILGEEVVTLLSDFLLSGSHTVEWDASNLASGVYLSRLQAGDFVETRKMVLVR